MSIVKKVMVVGAGLMGSGIAQVVAGASMGVVLVDSNSSALSKGVKSIETGLQRIHKKTPSLSNDVSALNAHVASLMKPVHPMTDIRQACKEHQPDLVIEAVVENLSVKRELFTLLNAHVKPEAVFGSNTSSLSIAAISKDIRPTQFGGIHFFNPVPVMKLVEIVRTETTSQPTFDLLCNFGKQIGKVVIPCKDTPGFVVNRLLCPYIMESIRMLDRGDAEAKDIDAAMKLGAGYPMGPFELADYVGLDTLKYIFDGWERDYPHEPAFKGSKLLDKLVAEGKFGKKTGEGFFKYT